MTIYSENGLYLIDENYKILYLNDAAKKLYPKAKEGEYCYRVSGHDRYEPCPYCPVLKNRKQSRYYDPVTGDLLSMQTASVELPQLGKCRSVTFNVVHEDEHRTSGIDREMVENIADEERTGMIGGFCEDGFPLYFANRRMIEMLGYDDYNDFYKGIDGLVANTIHPDDMAQVVKDIGPSYFEGLEYSTIYRMPKKDGSWFWVIDKGRVIKAEDGRLAIVSACTDMSEMLYNEEKLRSRNEDLTRQNKFMEFVADGMPGGYHRCACTEGYPLLYTSKKFLDMLGITTEELKEKYDNKFMNLVHPEDKDYLEGVSAHAENSADKDISIHYRIKSKDGYIHVMDNSRLLEHDGEKWFQGIIVAIDEDPDSEGNINALKQIRRSLQDALVREQGYRSQLKALQEEVLDSISCGVFAYTVPHREMLVINEAARRMMGFDKTVDPLEGIKDFIQSKMIMDQSDKITSLEKLEVLPGNTAAKDYRAEVDGRVLTLHSIVRLLERSDGQKYILVTLLDTTELMERSVQLDHSLTMQKQMADSLGSGVFAYTVPERRTLIINQEAKKMFDDLGLDPSKNGADVLDHILVSDAAQVKAAAKQLTDTGDSIEYIFHSMHENENDRRSYKCSTKRLEFNDGQNYIISALTDITAQEALERRLSEERRQYRRALAMGSECSFTIDLTDNMIKEPILTIDGKDFLSELGLSAPVSYDDFAKVCFSSDRVRTVYREMEYLCCRDGLIDCYENKSGIVDLEYHVKAEKKYMRLVVLLYRSGNHIHANFIFFDVTLDRQNERRRISIINSIGQIYTALYHITFTDNKFTVLKAHSDIKAELSDCETYTKFIEIYLGGYVLPEYKDEVADTISPQNIKNELMDVDYFTFEFKRKTLGWYRVNIVEADRDENGEVTAVVFAGHEIEKQKQTQIAQQEALKEAYDAANLANSAKTDFLANMSHDIRTPMNAIIGMTAIAATHIDDKDRVADCLSKISVSSKHLLGLINEVLDMSKIESGKMELQEEQFNLSDLIENLLTMSKPEVAKKDHDFTVSIRNIVHENVIGDSQRIQQVFMNLVSNAVKYTPNGGKISLLISERPTGNQQVGCYEFVFTDNGIGMSEEFLQHIFEPFTRATEDVRLTGIQGTGLGMPITRNIVQMMGGDIKVESKIDHGTRFTVTIFLRLANTVETVDYSKFTDLPVLVADDDECSCIYTCEMLSEIGMSGEWVMTGKEAVEKTVTRHDNGDPYFAVILDWKMPGMDGVETTRQIRRRIGKDIPIVIISAYDWTDIELEARAAGANAFISKPLFKSRMVHTFNELIGSAEEEENKARSELDALTKEDFSGKRALLVEDNELNAEIAGEILGMAGLTVEFAVNGKEALDIMAQAEDGYFDIVFMDVQMPVMNGYEATRAIRSIKRDYLRSVPIIAMTANAFAEDVAAAKNAGMNEHIAKPLDLERLVNTLEKWLSAPPPPDF